MFSIFVSLALLAVGVNSHGVLTEPISRALCLATNASDGVFYGGTCPGAACTWYSQKVVIPGKTTNCDPVMRTMGVNCDDKNPTDFPCTPGQAVPWCAPGSAPVRSPCGIASGGWNSRGRDMLDLPSSPAADWTAGEPAEVAFAITANHGGGYAYRLCPVSAQPSEECFQAHHLSFFGAEQWLVDSNHSILTSFPATRLSSGTHPVDSEWTRNPVPMEKDLGPPIAGFPDAYGRGPFTWSIKDRVLVPKDLPAGDYVLSWRWDAEQTKQVWSHCSDVHIKNPNKPGMQMKQGSAARHRHREHVKASKDVCMGESISLDIVDCATWIDIYDSLDGLNWPTTDTCNNLRLDPCGCEGNWDIETVCNRERDLLRLTEIYLLGPTIKGTIPSSIGDLDELVALSLVDTSITGVIPDTIGEASSLSMVWLDHNAQLGGAIPKSFAKLELTAFELHKSNFTGILPEMNYKDIPDCTLNGLIFDCPLPAGAETCGCACK